MSRKPRIEFKGALYHVINRGNNRQSIFFNNFDYRNFLNCLKLTQQRSPFILHGYILMPNHFHLILETLSDGLSRVMEILLTRYAKLYNLKYKKVGHVFQGRYKAILCQKDRYLLELIRYIHMNPVRANLVNNISEWEWSSHHAYLGRKEEVELNTGEVLSYFGKDLENSRKKYLEFIQERNDNFNVYPKENFPYLGDGEFVDEVSKNIKELRRKITPYKRMSLEVLAKKISEIFNIEVQMLTYPGKERKICEVRRIFCYVANKICLHRVVDIANFLNLSLPAVSRMIIKPPENGKIQGVIETLNVNK